MFCSTWNLPGPGIEPESPTLAGGFLITGPPGKSRTLPLFIFIYLFIFRRLPLKACFPQLLAVGALSTQNGLEYQSCHSLHSPALGVRDIHTVILVGSQKSHFPAYPS